MVRVNFFNRKLIRLFKPKYEPQAVRPITLGLMIDLEKGIKDQWQSLSLVFGIPVTDLKNLSVSKYKQVEAVFKKQVANCFINLSSEIIAENLPTELVVDSTNIDTISFDVTRDINYLPFGAYCDAKEVVLDVLKNQANKNGGREASFTYVQISSLLGFCLYKSPVRPRYQTEEAEGRFLTAIAKIPLRDAVILAKFYHQELLKFMEIEADLFKGDLTEIEKRAGVVRLDKYGIMNILDDISAGDPTKWDDILNMGTGTVTKYRIYKKELAEVRNKYSELSSKAANVE